MSVGVHSRTVCGTYLPMDQRQVEYPQILTTSVTRKILPRRNSTV